MVNKLNKWREDRNIKESNTMVYVENVIEELLEIFYDNKQTIEMQKSEIISSYFNGREQLSTNATIDAINDISVFSINEIGTMGYDFTKTMDETIKEISSRTQCKIQKEVWDNWKPHGKWKKSVTDEAKAKWYTADYSKCLINSI